MRTGILLATVYPQDKEKNGQGLRRALPPEDHSPAPSAPDEPIPPLLRRLLNDYAATGLPAAYLPKDEHREEGRQ